LSAGAKGREGASIDLGAGRVPAVSRAVALLDAVAASEKGLTLSEIARSLEAPKSSLFNICEALVGERLLRRDPQGRYRIGIRIAEFAAAQLNHPPRLKAIALVVQNFATPFFHAEAHAIKAAGAAASVEVTVFDSSQTLERQLEQLKALATSGIDAVILDPVDSEEVATGVAAVRAAGVPVVAVNAGASGADAVVATDNVQAGELIGRHLGATLRGAGDVVVVGGTRITGNFDRISGFLSALRDFPDIRIIDRLDGDNTRRTGREVARVILDRHPDVGAVFCINDPTALGILDAFEAQGASALILSVDGSSEALKSLRSGSGIIATAAQNPLELGRVAFKVAELLHSGARMPRRTWLLPTELIVPGNADSYSPWDVWEPVVPSAASVAGAT
jgi:ribose transport system substrate-binding protein